MYLFELATNSPKGKIVMNCNEIVLKHYSTVGNSWQTSPIVNITQFLSMVW